MNTEPATDAQASLWRAQLSGTLAADGDYWPVWFVHAHDGSLVLGAPEAALDAQQLVVHAPDETPASCHALLKRWRPAEGADADRWTAFHFGRDPGSAVRAEVESVRTPDGVYDGAEIVRANALADAESPALRRLNADRDALARAWERKMGVRPESPVAVGLDQFGLDVRGSAGVARMDWPSTLTESTLDAAVGAFLEGGA